MVLMRPTVLRTPDIAAAETARQKERLPGIAGAEAQVRAEERKEREHEQKTIFSHQAPLSPEDEKLYRKPPASSPPL
jgi:hypothetical protein